MVHPEPRFPSSHDAVTITCPVCQHPFTPSAAENSAPTPAGPPLTGDGVTPPEQRSPCPRAQPRRPITVYECDNCGNRAVGEQRCPDCTTFVRKIGLGGECPPCAEPVAVTDLLAQEVTAAN